MYRYLEKTRRFLWAFAEIGFLIVLVSVLIHLLLGSSSGGFVQGVYDNLVAFGRDVPSATLLGVGSLMLLIWYFRQRAEK